MLTQDGQAFLTGSKGSWAGLRLFAALQAGRQISPKELRTNDVLRKDEWISFDQVLVEEGRIRLQGVQDLIGAGLTTPIANALGKTLHQWEDVTDMEPAEVSLDGIARTGNDRQVFSINGVPLPITHKDFGIGLRTLAASRTTGETLDTSQAQVSGRLVTEGLENMLFNGGPTYGGNAIYGYTTHPNRNIAGFGAGTWSASGRTGAEILTDVLTMKSVLMADRFYGPYWIYIPANIDTKFEEDYKAESDDTIRERILRINRVDRITTVDQLADDSVIMVQASKDVVSWGNGEPLQTIQWDLNGLAGVEFKAFAIQVPIIKADVIGRSGVFHMS